MIVARVLADSLAGCGKRLTTWVATYPRAIHSEVLTHGALARNSASSRAIPTEKLIERVLDDPWIPDYIGKNQKGMQAGEELDPGARAAALADWLILRDQAVATARLMMGHGVHKQIVNRAIEPWMHITTIISATEVDNFFGLRVHPAAEPHFQALARAMRDTRDASTPKRLAHGEWHLPLWAENGGQPDDWEELARLMHGLDITADFLAAKIAVGRCARVSYLTHEGRRDLQADLRLHDDLMTKRPLHASPAEHVAQALDWPSWFSEAYPYAAIRDVHRLQNEIIEWRERNRPAAELPPPWVLFGNEALSELRSGRFLGFRQYRKHFVDENIGGRAP